MSADAHSQKLFCDLVASALRARMSDPSRMFEADRNFDDYYDGLPLPEDRLGKLESQVGSLVQDVSSLKGSIELMMGAFGLRSGPSHQQQIAQPQLQQFLQPEQEQLQHQQLQFLQPQQQQLQHQQQQIAQPQLQQFLQPQQQQLQHQQQQFLQPQQQQFLRPQQQQFLQSQQQQFLQLQQQQCLQPCAVVVPAAATSLQPHSNVGSSNSSPASPSRAYAFRCPICMKPQYTPKSHCSHMRKLVSDGQGYCCFRSDVAFHAGILRCHGNASQFVSWYTKRLRSSIGQDFTEADIRDYEQTHAQLQHDVQLGVVHNGN
jgi:hypothetical protein